MKIESNLLILLMLPALTGCNLKLKNLGPTFEELAENCQSALAQPFLPPESACYWTIDAAVTEFDPTMNVPKDIDLRSCVANRYTNAETKTRNVAQDFVAYVEKNPDLNKNAFAFVHEVKKVLNRIYQCNMKVQ